MLIIYAFQNLIRSTVRTCIVYCRSFPVPLHFYMLHFNINTVCIT